MKLDWYFWIGLLAGICIMFCGLPQLIFIIKTKNTVGTSLLTFMLMTFGDLLFVVFSISSWLYNLNNDNAISSYLPILISNFSALVICSTILTYKIKNIIYAKKLNISEKTFCENYKENLIKIRTTKSKIVL